MKVLTWCLVVCTTFACVIAQSCPMTDIVVVLDTCGDIGGSSEWKGQIVTLSRLISDIGLTDNGANLGVVFSGNGRGITEVPFASDAGQIISEVGSFPWYDSTYSSAGAGIVQAQTQLQTTGRSGAKQIIVVFTGSKQDDGADVIVAATAAKASGIQVFVVAADRVDEETMQQVVSKSSYYFYQPHFANLMPLMSKAAGYICNGTNIDVVTTNPTNVDQPPCSCNVETSHCCYDSENGTYCCNRSNFCCQGTCCSQGYTCSAGTCKPWAGLH